MHVFSEEDLDKAKFHFDRAGVSAKFVDVPHQNRTLRFLDAMGAVVELCATMQTKPRMHVEVHTHKGARALRMDHYQVLVPDVMGAAKFYMDLGFRISDYLVVGGTDFVIGMFLYRKNNPWDIVFLHRSGPRFHHCGYVEDLARPHPRPRHRRQHRIRRMHRARTRSPRTESFVLHLYP
jgi:catechol 2,3-dioxygenase